MMGKITKAEREAETIYKLSCLGLIDKELFVYMAMHLHSRSENSRLLFTVFNTETSKAHWRIEFSFKEIKIICIYRNTQTVLL